MSSDGPKKRRLFVGTFLPPEHMDAIVRLSEEYDERLSAEWNMKLRWVRGDKLHLTWLFLGGVEPADIPTIESKLSNALHGQAALDLQYSKPVFWPNPRVPRMMVTIPDTVPDAVYDLRGRIKAELDQFCERPEPPKYRPHITLFRSDAKMKSPRLEMPEWFDWKSTLPLHHHIDRVDLIESHLGGNKDYVSIWGQSLK